MTAELERIWFVRDERLTPVYRPGTSPEEAIRALLAGPSEAESTDVTTAIPTGTELRSIRVDGAVATIDLSRRFESGGGSLSMTERVAQVVYTLTEIPGVRGVLFAFDGEPVEFIGGEGIDVSTPVGRETFLDAKPFILVDAPRPGQRVISPLRIAGENSTFENNVEIALTTSDGRLLVQSYATGTGPIMDSEGRPLWGPFETSIEFDAGSATSGVLRLTETASDGSGRLLADFPVPVVFAQGPVFEPGVLEGASTDPVLVPSTGCCAPGPAVLLNNVTAQHMAGFDRIVFELSAPVAGYHVRYVPFPVTEDPSDLPVVLGGDNAIQVSMGATGVDQSGYPARQVYTGPLRIAVGTGSVVEVVQTGDFEAVLSWAIAVLGEPPFRVSAETNPARLVIDVASE